MKNSLVILFINIVMQGTAQVGNLNLNAIRPELFATTGVGRSYLNPSFKSISNNGFKTYTGVELQWINHYWARISYEISLYGFNNNIIQDGFKVKTKGTRTFLAGFIDIGYRKELDDFALYGFGGFGVGSLNAPNTTVNAITKEVNSDPLKKVHLALRTGLGIELEVKPKFIPFIEFQYSGLPGKTKVDNRELACSNILIGFKARLKRKN